MRAVLPIIALLMPLAAAADPFPRGDPQTGQKIVAEKKCEACHVRIMGGDGSGIYTRQNRLISTPTALLQRVAACNAQTNAGLFPEDEEHVAAHLNQRFYKFK